MFQGYASVKRVAELEFASAQSLLAQVVGDGGGQHGEDGSVRISEGSGQHREGIQQLPAQ